MPPLWRKAPFLLFRCPGVFLPIAAAVAVLTLGAASQPLFVSSAGGAAVDSEFRQLGTDSIGLQFGTYGVAAPNELQVAQRAVEQEAAKVPGLGRLTLMLDGAALTVLGDAREARMPLFFRSEALENVVVVEQAEGTNGVWLAASVAEDLSVEAGGDVRLRYGDRVVVTPVTGIYRDLAEVLPTAYWSPPDPLPADHPVVRYWGKLAPLIVLPTPTGPAVQAPLVLADQATMSDLSEQLQLPSRAEWSFAYDVSDPNLEQLRRTLPALRSMEGRANDPLDPLGEALHDVHLYRRRIPVHSFLPGVAQRVTQSVAALGAPVRALSLAAQGLALLVVAVAAAFGAQRRAVELRLLVVQGVPTIAQGAKAGLEAVLPAVAGAGLGWAAAVALVRVVGPSPDLSQEVIRAALVRAMVAATVAVLVVGAATARVARAQAAQGSSRLRDLAARAPWEVMVLVLAAAAYAQVVNAAPREDEPALSGLVLLFPLLLIAGGAGLVARLLARLLPRLRGDRGGRGSAALYLARRRLAAAPSSALLLVAASALSIGVLVFAAAAASTTRESLDLKAAVSLGSDVSVDLGRDASLTLAQPNTRVEMQQADVLGGTDGEVGVDVLAIDPQTFPEAVRWSPTYSSQPLPELMALLEGEGERLPLIATGGAVPSRGTLTTSRYQIPITVAARVRAFPGMDTERPLVVVDADRFFGTVKKLGTSSVDERFTVEGRQWIRGDAAQIVRSLNDQGVPDESITSAATLQSRPDILARSWTLGYLQAVGVVAGLLAFVGTLLYLGARQASREVAYVLARRMGLTAAAHRRSVAVELAGMLGIATATGTVLALLAAWLLLAQLDPLPEVAPAPLLALPQTLLVATAGAIGLACLVGAAAVQRAADRARVSEVLRLAT